MLIDDGLRDAGDFDVMVIAEDAGLARRITHRNPDIVLIDAGNPSRDVLEELTQAFAPMQRPVAMFVDQSDQTLTKAAIEAGVSAYVVDGLRGDRIKLILDAAIARFHMLAASKTEAVIPSIRSRKTPVPYDTVACIARNLIERAFSRLKDWRRVATRYDKRAVKVESTIAIAAIILRWT